MNDKTLTNPFPVIGMLIRLSALIFTTSLLLMGLHLLFDVALISIFLLAGLLWTSMVVSLMIIRAFARLGPWKVVVASLIAAAPRLMACLIGLVICIKVYQVPEAWALIDMGILYSLLLMVETYMLWRFINQTQWNESDTTATPNRLVHPGTAHKEVCTS